MWLCVRWRFSQCLCPSLYVCMCLRVCASYGCQPLNGPTNPATSRAWSPGGYERLAQHSLNFLVNMTMVEEAGPALLSIAGGVFAVAGGHEQSPRMAMTGLRFAGILGQVPENIPPLLESDVVAFIKVCRRTCGACIADSRLCVDFH